MKKKPGILVNWLIEMFYSALLFRLQILKCKEIYFVGTKHSPGFRIRALSDTVGQQLWLQILGKKFESIFLKQTQEMILVVHILPSISLVSVLYKYIVK